MGHIRPIPGPTHEPGGVCYNGPYPVETLRAGVLPAMGLSVSEAAKQIGVTLATLLSVLNGHLVISIGMALCLKRYLGVEQGGRAGLWLEQQLLNTLWQTRQKIQAIGQ